MVELLHQSQVKAAGKRSRGSGSNDNSRIAIDSKDLGQTNFVLCDDLSFHTFECDNDG
ncbi:uncharacterized protein LOC106639435 isoform X2 [Copidosoma floridanum]|uniref:uncharacterized protein LOC106639435 isoform X2 n=1 Tax=Copidosoma floridanum TaxID=29053 RepID=UPI0006C952B1|nr:uncharacterized protein LOC106639435 isoform X2 [Copidosoma floridanum]